MKEDTVAHWQRMHDNPEDCLKRGEFLNRLHCAFCVEYWADRCINCPIYLDTDAICCEETNYGEALLAWGIYHDNPTPETLDNWQQEAYIMIDYLKELEC